MKRRLTSLLLVLAMILTLLPVQVFAAAYPVDTANPFVDVARGSWYYDAVQYVRMNGLFSGTSKTTFSPDDTMTRGMFVTVLGRMAGVNPDNYAGPSSFTDVPETAYYAPYVAWAVKYGVTVGTGDGKFSPNDYINRQQMAVFFVRYFELFGVAYETGANITTTPADIDSVSPWARDAVLKLWRTGLLVGNGGSFTPLSNATRAQTATICYRTDKVVDTWYSEPGIASTRVKINPATGLPYDDGSKPSTPTKPTGGSSGGGNGGGGNGGGTTPPPTPSDSYAVSFYDGSRLMKTLYAKKGEPLGQVPTVSESSKAGYILEGYYTDSGFTTPFYADSPVTGSMSVYAKYESMGDAETLTLDSFARMDQQPNVAFRFRPLAGTADTLSAAQAAVTLSVKDGSDPVEITVTGGGIYTVFAPAGFHEGCSYELNLAEGWTFLPDGSDTIPSEAIRTAAFSIDMAEVENLSMNDGIRYVKDTDQINYTYTDKDNRSYSNVEELASDADFTNGGNFNYDNTSGWQNGDILCIYVGGKPDSNESEPTKEAVYAKVSGISGTAVSFTPLAEEDRVKLYDIPDNFPITVAALPAGNTGTVSINSLDTALYAQMVGASEETADKAKEKLSEGDFITLYVSSANIASENDVYFGRVTAIDSDTITYEQCTAQDIRDSADLYTHVEMSGEDLITDVEKAEIEQTVLAQAERSGFAEDAAWMLLDMASQTDGFQNTAALRNVLIQDGAGNELSAESVRYLARSARNVGGKFELGDDVNLKVELITSGDQLHYRNEGVQLAIGVEAEFEVDAEEGKVHINLSATFVQEVAVKPTVKGELVYYELLGFIPVPNGVQINAAVDVKSFTAMSLKAEIFTEGPEDQNLWEQFQDFAKDPSALGDIPGLPDEIKQGMESVGDALKKIDEMKEEIKKEIDDLPGYENYIAAIWERIDEATNGKIDQEKWEELGEQLEKTDITAELMNLMNLTSDTDLSVDYIDGLSDLMDRYSELLEKETDWVTLVNAQMFDTHTPAQYGIMVGIQGNFVVRTDLNLAIGSNLQYEVGKRYNFWFRVGLFTPSSGSSSMDLIDESFAFQFYVMGKLGVKAGVRLKIYAAIGSVDAVSVGLTTELGPYLKLWGFFIYDYSKYRPANTKLWSSKEQMAGALYLEFGLYLMVGVEAKTLFLEYDHDFVDEEFPLLSAGDKKYYYDTAYEPLDESDEIVVYNDGTATLQDGCAVSMVLPEDTYAINYIDLTTGRQGAESLTFDNYSFKVSNPNFRVDNVGGKPVISVISIPQNVRLMQCDLTITYKHGKLAFSTFDMSTTVHLAWTNMTAAEYQQVYTASVTVPDGNGGREVIWSQRVRKGTPFDLPAEDEIRKLLSWSDAKYTTGSGYGSQPTEGVTLIENTQYNYDLGYQTYQVTVTGIEGGNSSRTFTGKYGEPFNFSSLLNTGTDGPSKYTRFVGLMVGGQTLALNQPITGKFAAFQNTIAEAQYEDETATATFTFTGTGHADIEVTLRRGDTPDTSAVLAAVPDGLTVTGFYPRIGPMDGDMTYQVVCEAPRGGDIPGAVSITFNANGGSEVAAISRTPGSVLGTLPTPTRTGYGFDGWYTVDGDKVDENTVVPEGGMTLYANWIEGSVTVTFNTNGGLNLTENTKSVAYGQPYGTLPTPERSGYHFLGWFTAADETSTEVTAATAVGTEENHTLYAHWRQLKTIPSSVFDFGTPEPVTYDKTAHTATYTFNPDSLTDCPEESSFTVSYTRVSDEFIGQNVTAGTNGTEADADGNPITAGAYIVTITREADDTYAKFDQAYGSSAADAVLVINRATRDLSGITDSDIVLGETGLTYVYVELTDACKERIDLADEGINLIYRVGTSSGTTNYYDGEIVEEGLLYDLFPGRTNTITGVKIKGDINYVDAMCETLNKQFTTNSAPTDNWSDYADTNWYDASQTEFTITTPEQLAGLAKLVNEQEVTFENKTVYLNNAVFDMSAHLWTPITGQEGTAFTPMKSYFKGKFEGIQQGGKNPVISGVCVSTPASDFSGSNNYKGFFGYGDRNNPINIKNIKLEDSYITMGTGSTVEGGLLSLYAHAILENCESNATVSGMTDAIERIRASGGSVDGEETCTVRPLPGTSW